MTHQIKHDLRYVDLRPSPVRTDDPSPLMVWMGALMASLALWTLTVVAFAL